jgi:hypothetical protein
MPRSSDFDRAAMAAILARQYRVISRSQAMACGMTESTLQHRLRAGGPWQRLLPGVFLTVTGAPTNDQREVAALLYAGPGSLLADVRALVAAVVQQDKCTPEMLAAELQDGPVQGSALLRIAVADVHAGTRSNPEADLHDLIRRAKLPVPEFNPKLYAGEEFIGSPDAWWQYAGVAAEVDSNEYHLSPEDHERTLARDRRMRKYNINVLHFTPRQIRTQPTEVIAALRSALAAPSFRPPVPIRTVSVTTAPSADRRPARPGT